jgi:hypothetical protein
MVQGAGLVVLTRIALFGAGFAKFMSAAVLREHAATVHASFTRH